MRPCMRFITDIMAEVSLAKDEYSSACASQSWLKLLRIEASSVSMNAWTVLKLFSREARHSFTEWSKKSQEGGV